MTMIKRGIQYLGERRRSVQDLRAGSREARVRAQAFSLQVSSLFKQQVATASSGCNHLTALPM